jgi:hypothetical protein
MKEGVFFVRYRNARPASGKYAGPINHQRVL